MVLLEWLVNALLRSAPQGTAGTPAYDVAHWALLLRLLDAPGAEAEADALGLASVLRAPLVTVLTTVVVAVVGAAAASAKDDATEAFVRTLHSVYTCLNDRHGAAARPTLEQAAALAAALLQAAAAPHVSAAVRDALVAWAVDSLQDLRRMQLQQAAQRKVFALFCSRVLGTLAPSPAASPGHRPACSSSSQRVSVVRCSASQAHCWGCLPARQGAQPASPPWRRPC